MKRFIMTIAAALMITASASAMSYSEARSEAQYLTDKMAYELGLDDEQYAEAYQINLSYLMDVDDYGDIYSSVWSVRNRSLHALFSYNQWARFIGAKYFYRPLGWRNGDFYLNVYNRYPQRDMAMNRMGRGRGMEYGNMRGMNDNRGYRMEYGEHQDMNRERSMSYNNERGMNGDRSMSFSNDRQFNNHDNAMGNRRMQSNNSQASGHFGNARR